MVTMRSIKLLSSVKGFTRKDQNDSYTVVNHLFFYIKTAKADF